jgi:hypothetical protein
VKIRFRLTADQLWPHTFDNAPDPATAKIDAVRSLHRELTEGKTIYPRSNHVRIGRFSVGEVKDLTLLEDGSGIEGVIEFNTDKIELREEQ